MGITAKSKFDHVDGLIIFHHEWDSLLECSRSFKEVYPEGQLFIARDHLPMKHFNRLDKFNPRFISTYSTTQIFVDLKFNEETLDDISDADFLSKVDQHLKRMLETLIQCKNEYILYLEADSLVRSKTIITEDFDMDSLDPNPYPAHILDIIHGISGTRLPIQGWGFVTGLMKVQSGLNMIRWAKNNEDVVLKLFHADRRFIHLDYFAPILMHLSGGKVIKSGFVGECLRDPQWKKKPYTLLHQYRYQYRKI